MKPIPYDKPFQDPDKVGSSEYRALHELCEGIASNTGRTLKDLYDALDMAISYAKDMQLAIEELRLPMDTTVTVTAQEEPEDRWRRARVTCDGLTGASYECYIHKDDPAWNGWARPWFIRDIGLKILSDNPETLDWFSGDRRFGMVEQRPEGRALQVVPVQDTLHGRLHAIGNGSWCWKEVR